MIDIHCHIIPGVDDGAKDLAMAEKMLAAAAADGIDTIICTPHSSGNPEQPGSEIIPQLQQSAASWNITLLEGMEYSYQHLSRTTALKTLGNSSFLLIDFHRAPSHEAVNGIFFDLARRGFQIIVAHPERSFRDLSDIEKLHHTGAYFQLSADSFLGEWGRQPLNMAMRMFKHGLCHYIASDAHGGNKMFHLRECRQLLSGYGGPNCIDTLMDENPCRLLKNQPPLKVLPEKRPATGFRRLIKFFAPHSEIRP